MVDRLVDEEKGKLFFTPILDSINDAKFISSIYSKGDLNQEKRVHVYSVKNAQQKPVYILKVLLLKGEIDALISEVRKEFEIGKTLKHQNIAKTFDMKEASCNDGTYSIEILQEYGGESLSSIIKERRLSAEEILNIICQIVNAMVYVRGRLVFHSDLKLNNIVYDGIFAKIIDFGISFQGEEATFEEYTRATNGKIRGYTGLYASPEFQKWVRDRWQRVNLPKIDVYAYGMVVLLLLCHHNYVNLPPLEEIKAYREEVSSYERIKSLIDKLSLDHLHHQANIDLRLFLSECLSYSPCDRPTFRKIQEIWLPKLCRQVDTPNPKPEDPSNRLKKIGIFSIVAVLLISAIIYKQLHIVTLPEIKVAELVVPENGLQINHYDPPSIRKLEDILVAFGYLKNGDLGEKDREVYGYKMSEALGRYQEDCVARGFIKPEDLQDNGKGSFGPKTRKILRKDVYEWNKGNRTIFPVNKAESKKELSNWYINKSSYSNFGYDLKRKDE